MAKKILVVYFSRTGRTREAARAIAQALDADLEELNDPSAHGGLFGYLRSGFDVTSRQKANLAPPVHDPSKYELVVVGTPVWHARLSSPVRTYLAEFGRRMKRLAIFECFGTVSARRTAGQIAELCDRKPIAELVLTERDKVHKLDAMKVARFVETLRTALAGETRPSFPMRSSHASLPA
jgi:hypothetical protein